MTNSRNSAPGLSPEETRKLYPEFSRLLITRMNQILPWNSAARLNLDEQLMTSPGDEGDASVMDTSTDYFLKLANTHQRELVEIREALDHIHRGVYGVCESCGEPIAVNRLRKLPYARLCIECQSAKERSSGGAGFKRTA